MRTGTAYLPTAATYLFGCILTLASFTLLSKDARPLSPIYLFLISLVIMALSAGLISRLDTQTSLSTILGLQMLFGVGAAIGALKMMALPCSMLTDNFTRFQDMAVSESVRIFAEMLGG